MDPSARTLSGSVRSLAQQNAHADAVVDDVATLSWSALDALAELHTSTLARFAPGSRVVLLLPQRAASVALLTACERARLDVVLVSALYGEAWARARSDELLARALLTLEGDEICVLHETDAAPEPIGEEPGVLVLTSGTTGKPKCARHSWRTLAGAVKARSEFAGSRWLIGYPLSHFAALQVVAQVVFSGATLIVPPDFAADTALRMLTANGAEFLCATPSYVRQLLLAAQPADWQAMRLKQITLGGEIADGRLLHGLRDAKPGLQLTHIYASTELGAIITVRDGEEGFDAALLDEQKLRHIDGQLYARRTARAMLGYLGDAAAAPSPSHDGDWVATGDLIEVVANRALFRGRVNDVINVGGYKVNPVDIENVIREVPGVREVCVIGQKSSILGALPKAIIVAKPDADRASVQAEIVRRCGERLAPYMVPRLFEFADRIERSTNQKMLRR
jgi:acyl-CoA synthetase (AMP-forming)/AMP-acid ligase II